MTERDDVGKLAVGLRHLILASERSRTAFAAHLHIGVTELRAMGHLAEAGSLTPKELSGRLGITTGSVTGLTDRLEAAGLVFRAANPGDRRSILLRLSPAGEHATRWVQDQFHAALSEAVLGGSAGQIDALADFLDHAAQVLARDSAQRWTDLAVAGHRPATRAG
jgi:DNA-binding MarR family transcriptional regulator